MDVFGAVSLADAAFWIAVAAAMLLQPLQVNEYARRILLAAVNVWFLTWLLGTAVWVPITLLLACWALAWSFTFSARVRLAGGICAVVFLFGIFIGHRTLTSTDADLGIIATYDRMVPGVIRQLVWDLELRRFFPAIGVIGFAYIFLRAIDMLRECWETRQRAPFLSCINYLMPFHMLPAGPILAWNEYQRCDRRTKITSEQALRAAERIATGMFKKFVIAYAIQGVFLTGFQTSGLMFVVEVHFFFIWLYLDFSGYSDVAVGVGALIGVHTPENFDRPYLARNMINFWERWHITLSQFIRRNVFIPLESHLLRRAGGKGSLPISAFVFFVAFTASGLWHSFAPGFLLWALAHVVGVTAVVCYRHWLKRRIGNKGLKAYMKNPVIRVIAIVVTFEYVAWTLIPVVTMGSW